MIPAFHDYTLEPKITKYGDFLYKYDVQSFYVRSRDHFIVTYLALSPWPEDSEVTVLSDLLDLSYFLNKII